MVDHLLSAKTYCAITFALQSSLQRASPTSALAHRGFAFYLVLLENIRLFTRNFIAELKLKLIILLLASQQFLHAFNEQWSLDGAVIGAAIAYTSAETRSVTAGI